jgi:hypothetical protein
MKSLHIGDPDIICLAWTVNSRTCKCMMSTLEVDFLASAIQPTSQCSSCLFMYVNVNTRTGGSHVTDSYVDDLNIYNVGLAPC